jgi:hypothetical protein
MSAGYSDGCSTRVSSELSFSNYTIQTASNTGVTMDPGSVASITSSAYLMICDAPLGVSVGAGARFNKDMGTLAATGLTKGVKIYSGGMAFYQSKPTFTTSGNNTEIGGTAKTWAAIPYIEPTNNAAYVVNQ